MNRLIRLLPVLILGSIAVVVILILAPDASIPGGIKLSHSADEIRSSSVNILRSQGIDPHPFRSEIRLKPDKDLLLQVQTSLGLAESNRLLRSGVPGYRWIVRWSKRSSITISIDDDEDQVEQVTNLVQGDIRVEFDTGGRLLRFVRTVPDSMDLPSIPDDSVLSIAASFLKNQGAPLPSIGGTEILTILSDSTTQSRPQELVRRTDHILEWSLRDDVTQDPVRLRIKVSGSFVSDFSISYEVPARFREAGTRTLGSILEAVIFTGLFIAIVVISFRRFRAYEIGFRLAIAVGIATGLGLGIRIYTMLGSSNDWEIAIPIIFGTLFYGGGAMIAWAASEAIVRETWREKAVTLDLLMLGYVTHSRIGQSIVRGVCLGLAVHAVSLVAAYGAGTFTNVGQMITDDDMFNFVVSDIPSLAILIESFTSQIFPLTIFLMFLMSWLTKRTGRPFVAGAIVVMLLIIGSGAQFHPLWTGILITGIPFSLIIIAFLRYDVLTAFIVLFVSSMSTNAVILAGSEHPFYEMGAALLGGMVLLLTVAGIAAQLRRDETVDVDAISPVFAKHITERERLRHELAIARNVQMSFLPKANPVVSTLDIASRCAPALEVGGDYYDFIELPDGQLGVAVGDVSGKGTRAAFFMTLTKGFLRALARVTYSPGKVLDEVNRLFYENVERGTFISLIYGVFDTMRSRLTIARAGHNPVILRKSTKQDTQVLNPMGLALGLDKGDVFSQSVKEVSVDYDQGDVFVFYTDGISEAMNRTREEYGEDRLSASIEVHAHKSAADILEGILRDMHAFVGKAEQHDDVTLVVVKIS